MTILALALAILFFIAGLAGTLLPVLPGPILIWLGMFIYGRRAPVGLRHSGGPSGRGHH